MPSISWSGVKLTTIGLWNSGNVFSGVMNPASSSGISTDESGCFAWFGHGPLVPVKG
jgi:hypothetical protein